MSARGLNSSGGPGSAVTPSPVEETLVCPLQGQNGGASAFWLTVAAGTAPSHLGQPHPPSGSDPQTPDLVTRELEMANPDLLRLFKQQ